MIIRKETKKFTFQATINKDVAKIDYIFVHHNYRGLGIAKQLISDFVRKVKRKGINKISIDAYWETISFWKNQNFKIAKNPQVIDGYKQDYYDGVLYL